MVFTREDGIFRCKQLVSGRVNLGCYTKFRWILRRDCDIETVNPVDTLTRQGDGPFWD